MFTAFLQFMDLAKGFGLHLFLSFFLASWAVFIIKSIMIFRYKMPVGSRNIDESVSVIIPVADEAHDVWKKVLASIYRACRGMRAEFIVVANGNYSDKILSMAKEIIPGVRLITLQEGNKRKAITEGVAIATGQYSIMLDSDSISQDNTVKELVAAFNGNPRIGGITPKHRVFNAEKKGFVRLVCDWLEDIRFYNVMGQSSFGCVSCLPGRLYAMRTDLLRQAMPEFLGEKWFGQVCITGDDRFLTSWLLKNGYKTLYAEQAIVYTDAPETIYQLFKQRLRWARSSFRETLISTPWISRYPYMAFTIWSEIILKWLFFIVIINAAFSVLGIVGAHRTWIGIACPRISKPYIILMGVTAGYLISGLLRQIPHLRKHPQRLKYLPIFLLIGTFIITPAEWYGHLTSHKNDWLTRNVQ